MVRSKVVNAVLVVFPCKINKTTETVSARGLGRVTKKESGPFTGNLNKQRSRTIHSLVSSLLPPSFLSPFTFLLSPLLPRSFSLLLFSPSSLFFFYSALAPSLMVF